MDRDRDTDTDLGLGDAAERRMASYLAAIATGPTLSRDLSQDQATDGVGLCLDRAVPDAQIAAFLIALRMKRETGAELRGAVDAVRARTCRAVAAVDDLVDIAEPYNGYLRHLSPVAFVPAVLAACGVPAVLTGCRTAAPKLGLTAHRVLVAAGADVGVAPGGAAARIADESIGWAYVDQAVSCPSLHGLGRLRALIVKRPCLSLVEKLSGPVVARGRTHLWVGWTHREYPAILHDLARHAGYASMLAVRGVEGGVLTSLAGAVKASACTPAAPEILVDLEVDPSGALAPAGAAAGAALLSGSRTRAGGGAARVRLRAPPLPATAREDAGSSGHAGPGDAAPADVLDDWARHAADAGLAALSGHPGPTADALVLGAAAVLRHLGLAGGPDGPGGPGALSAGVARAREAIAGGAALARFRAGAG